MVRDRFPWVKLIKNSENVGFARANNQGIEASSGEYVLLLNSDTVVHRSALASLIFFMENNSRAGACGARLLNGDGSLQHACHPMLTPEREFWRLMFLERLGNNVTYPMQRWDTHRVRQVEVIKGACLLVRRQALDQVGLLDEGYFMYTEEVDLCYRLAQAGWSLWYVPQAIVTHFGGASSRQVHDEMYLELYRSKVRFYRKYGGEGRANHFKGYLAVAYGLRATLFGVAAMVQPDLLGRARLYRRLLAELPGM